MAFLTNFTESLFGRIIPKGIGEMMPKSKDLIEKTKENLVESGGVIDKINGKINIVKDSLKGVSKIHKNALKQIKSGKFGEAVSSDGDAGFGDMGDMESWGNDDWGSSSGDDWGSDSSGGSSEYGDVSNEVTNNYEQNNYQTNYQTNGDERITAAVTTQTGLNSSGFATVAASLNEVVRQIEMMNAFHNEKTSAFYEASLEGFKSIAEFNTNLSESIRPISEYYAEIAEKKKPKDTDEFDIKQILNPAYHLKKILDHELLGDNMIEMLTKGVKDAIIDPVGSIFQQMLFGGMFAKGFIPTVAGGKIKRFEDMLETLPYILQGKLQQWSNNRDNSGDFNANNILAYIGDMFKMDLPTAKITATIDKESEATFDARTRRAIITEIPIYLNKIYTELQKSNTYLQIGLSKPKRKEADDFISENVDGIVFDNEKGRMVGEKDRRKELYKKIKDINEGEFSGGVRDALEPFLNTVLSSDANKKILDSDKKVASRQIDSYIKLFSAVANSSIAPTLNLTSSDDIQKSIEVVWQEEAERLWNDELKKSKPVKKADMTEEEYNKQLDEWEEKRSPRKKVSETDIAYELRKKKWEKEKEAKLKGYLDEKYKGVGGKEKVEAISKAFAASMENGTSIEDARAIAEREYEKSMSEAAKIKNHEERKKRETEIEKRRRERIQDAESGDNNAPANNVAKAVVMQAQRRLEAVNQLNADIVDNSADATIFASAKEKDVKFNQAKVFKNPIQFENQDLIDRVFNWKDDFSGEVSNLIKDIGDYLGNALSTGSSKVINAVDWVYTKFSNTGNYATAALMATYSDKNWDTLLKEAENTSLVDAFKNSFELGIINPLKELMLGTNDKKKIEETSFIEAVKQSFDDNIMIPLKKFLTGESDNKKAGETSLFEAIKTGLDEKIYQPLSKLLFGKESDTSIWESMTNKLSELSEKVVGYVTKDLFGSVRTLLGEVGTQVSNAFEGVKKFLFEDLTEGTKSVFNSVFGENAIDTVRKTLVEPFTAAVSKLTDTVSSMIKWVFALPVKLVNSITNFSRSSRGDDTKAEDSTKIRQSTNRVRENFEGLEDKEKDQAKKIGVLVKNNEELTAKYKQLAISRSMKVSEELEAFNENVSLKENILNQLRKDNDGEEFEKEAEKIADFIIEGMLSELTENGEAVSDTVKNTLGDEPLKAIREAWDIHSPSREMIEIAKFIRQGFSIGLESNSKGNSVEDTIKKVFSDVPKEILTKSFGVNKGKSKYMSDFATNLVRSFIDTLLDNKKNVKDYFDKVFNLPISVNTPSIIIGTATHIGNNDIQANAADNRHNEDNTIGRSVLEIIKSDVKDIKSILTTGNNITESMRGILSEIRDKTGQTNINITEGSGVPSFINNPFAYLGDKFGKLMEAPILVLGQTAESFGKFIESMKDIPGKIFDFMGDASHKFVESLGRMMPDVTSLIENTFSTFNQLFTNTFQRSADWFDQLLDRLGESSKKLFENLKKSFRPFVKVLEEGAQLFLERLTPGLDALSGALNHVIIGLTEFGTKIFDTLLVAGNKVLDFGAGLFDYLRGKNSVVGGSVDKITRASIVNWGISLGASRSNPLFVNVVDGLISIRPNKAKRTISANSSDVQDLMLGSSKEKEKKEDEEDNVSENLLSAGAGALGGAITTAVANALGNKSKIPSKYSNELRAMIPGGKNMTDEELRSQAKSLQSQGNSKIMDAIDAEDEKIKKRNTLKESIREKLNNAERNQKNLRTSLSLADQNTAAERARNSISSVTETAAQNDVNNNANSNNTNTTNNNERAKATPAERSRANRTTSNSRIERLTAKGRIIPERMLLASDPNTLSEEAKNNIKRSERFHINTRSSRINRNMTTGQIKKALNDPVTRSRMSNIERLALESRLDKRKGILGGIQNIGVGTNQLISNSLQGNFNILGKIGGVGERLSQGPSRSSKILGKGLSLISNVNKTPEGISAVGKRIRQSGSLVRSGQYAAALQNVVTPHNSRTFNPSRTFTSHLSRGAKAIGGFTGKLVRKTGEHFVNTGESKISRGTGKVLKLVGGVTEKVGRATGNLAARAIGNSASFVTNKAVGSAISATGALTQGAGKIAGMTLGMAGKASSMAGRAFTNVQNMSMMKALGLSVAGGLGSMAADKFLEQNSTEHKLAKSASGLVGDIGTAASLNAIPVIGQISSALYIVYKVFTRIPELFKALVNFVEDKFKDQINGMTTFFLELPDKITSFTEKIPAWIEGMGENLTNSIEEMFSGPTAEDFDPETGLPIDSGKPSILWMMAKAFGKAGVMLVASIPDMLVKTGIGLVKLVTGFFSTAIREWGFNIVDSIGNSISEGINEIKDSFEFAFERTVRFVKTLGGLTATEEEERIFNEDIAKRIADRKKQRDEERTANLIKHEKKKEENKEAARNWKQNANVAIDHFNEEYNPAVSLAKMMKELPKGFLNIEEDRIVNRYRESMEAGGGNEELSKAEYAKRFLNMSDEDIKKSRDEGNFEEKINAAGFLRGKEVFDKIVEESKNRRYQEWKLNQISNGANKTEENFRAEFDELIKQEASKGKDVYGFNQGSLERNARALNEKNKEEEQKQKVNIALGAPPGAVMEQLPSHSSNLNNNKNLLERNEQIQNSSFVTSRTPNEKIPDSINYVPSVVNVNESTEQNLIDGASQEPVKAPIEQSPVEKIVTSNKDLSESLLKVNKEFLKEMSSTHNALITQIKELIGVMASNSSFNTKKRSVVFKKSQLASNDSENIDNNDSENTDNNDNKPYNPDVIDDFSEKEDNNQEEVNGNNENLSPPGEMLSFKSTPVPTNGNEVIKAIAAASRDEGVDYGLLYRMAVVESNLDPNAKAKGSSAKGLFQFTDGTAAIMGIKDVFDPYQNANAAARYIKENAKILSKAGIPLNDLTAYLAHQQGPGGILQIWKEANGSNDPNNISSKIRNNMINNSPFSVRRKDLTPREFIAGWQKKIQGQNTIFPSVNTSDVKINSNINKFLNGVLPSNNEGLSNSTQLQNIGATKTSLEGAALLSAKPTADTSIASAVISQGIEAPKAYASNTQPTSDIKANFSPIQSQQPAKIETPNITNEMMQELKKQTELLTLIVGNTNEIKESEKKIENSFNLNNKNIHSRQPATDVFGSLLPSTDKQTLEASPAARRIASGI